MSTCFNGASQQADNYDYCLFIAYVVVIKLRDNL